MVPKVQQKLKAPDISVDRVSIEVSATGFGLEGRHEW
jgi:hypothetical protein